MDCKIPTWATGILSVLLFFLMSIFSGFGQSKTEKEYIKSTYDTSKMNLLVSKMEAEHRSKKDKIDQILKENDWKETEKLADGTVVALKDIGTDGTPIFYTTFNDPSRQVSRAHTLYEGGLLDLGLDGTGMQVGVWDAGIARMSHQEFDTRATKGDDSEEVDSHATLVLGNIISSGIKPNAKGVAFGAKGLTHDWTRDKIEVTEAAANGLLLSNHSYGIKSDRVPDWYFGAYIKVSQDWDKIMYNAPYYLMVTAAGNAQKLFDNEAPVFGSTADGYDVLLGFATTKNGLVIAGANTKIDANGEVTGASVSGYSSFGPIDDGRIKPDLAGDGSSILTTSATSDSSYLTSAGTSMAAPGVTGALLLLQEYHKELYGGFMKAATLKGLALHTADDVDAKGPDYKMGWGIINVKAAAETLQNRDYRSLITEESLTDSETFSMTVNAVEGETLMASISWTDPEGSYINRGDLNDPTPALINDLDIRITKDGETYYPWKLNASRVTDVATIGDNTVDPYERIEIENASGEYKITVSHKGSLTNQFQDFSIVVSGVKASACSVEAPAEVQLFSSLEDSASISWQHMDDTLFEIQYKSLQEENWTSKMVWENNLELLDLEKGMVYEARVRSVCTENAVSDFSDEIYFEFNGTETELITRTGFGADETLEIEVYPNPTTDWLKVEANLSPDAVYSVVTPSGNIIKRGNPLVPIQVADLSSGLYILMVQDHLGTTSTKFYKN